MLKSKGSSALVAALCGAVLSFCAGSVLAQAQKPAPPVPDPAFPKLFTKYTGQNGYEDFVVAGDLVRANPVLLNVDKSTATLKELRAALEDANISRALKLVRTGLDKPIESPRDPAKMDEDTLLPEYGEFRSLARLMGVEIQVYLADGQVGRAIDCMRDGLRFGYVVQNETLIGGLVGIAIDSVVLEKFAAHFDQMALRDCIHVTTVAQEWLKQPGRSEVVMTAEHNGLTNMLEGWKSDPERLRKMVKEMLPKDGPQSDSDVAAIELNDFVNSSGAAIPAMLDQVLEIAKREDGARLIEIRKPAWERRPVQVKKPELRDSMASRLYGLVSPAYGQVVGRFDMEIARIHLLGTHGAIRRFRWENGRLPSSLAELNLPAMCTDPFTGGPLVYKIAGDRYELNSTGPKDGVGGQIVPLFLPRG